MTGSQIQLELFNFFLVPHLMCHRTGCEVRKALKKQDLVNITAAHKTFSPDIAYINEGFYVCGVSLLRPK
jgi:hypothetical protein